MYMKFSGPFDWCILVVHHTDMPASQYPLQRAGVDVELLDREADIKRWLKSKVTAAIADKNPMYLPPV